MPVILYLATVIPFLALDALMLNAVMAPLFRRHIGPLMLEAPNLLPAAGFYAAYVAGLVWLVSLPALRGGGSVLLPAAVLGALCYGTFEFTAWSVLKGWNWRMVVTDVLWGTVLTAGSAWIGVAVARRFGA